MNLKTNLEKAGIPEGMYKHCFGCGNEYDSRVMFQFMSELHCPGCTQELLHEFFNDEDE